MDLVDSILKEGNYLLQQKVKNWQEAVQLGCQILEQKGYITTDYYQAIVSQTKKLGPFYLLGPGIAMPHARPEDGVLKGGFSLVTLATPVKFGDSDNDPINLLITLAAENSEDHIQFGIVPIVTLLDNEQAVATLKNAKSFSEIKPIFENLEI